ncbi:MAG: nucleoside deaminase [Thermodesulfobacteriota bacterium]
MGRDKENNEMRDHNYFMDQALELATAALAAGEFPVGCVMVADDQVVSTGQRANSREEVNEIDHAEVIALRHLLRHNQQAPDPAAITVYSTLEPCLMCYSTMLISGIRSFVFAFEDAMGGGTGLNLSHLPPLYQEMRPAIKGHVRRNESLALFQKFFNAPNSDYLQDTYLAQYTLAQRRQS